MVSPFVGIELFTVYITVWDLRQWYLAAMELSYFNRSCRLNIVSQLIASAEFFCSLTPYSALRYALSVAERLDKPWITTICCQLCAIVGERYVLVEKEDVIVYEQDGSIFQVMPEIVVLPADRPNRLPRW